MHSNCLRLLTPEVAQGLPCVLKLHIMWLQSDAKAMDKKAKVCAGLMSQSA
jgi:hypothetical protein